MTNDVESTSLELNKPADFMAAKIRNIGLPRLMDLFAKYDVESTFFFTAHIVKIMPELIDIVNENGHEIACHGYIHEPEYFFDGLTFEKQLKYLQLARKIIESASNTTLQSFRGPEARINEDTIRVLEKLGFKYDTSIASQRFDGPLSRGFKKKIFWMIAPRRPYYVSLDSIVQEGDSNILEIPISAFIFPFIGSTMRVSPKITKKLQNFLFRESKRSKNPIVFLFHPTECIEIDEGLLNQQSNIEGSFFSGVVRKRIKIKNLGEKAVQLLENVLRQAKAEGFEFLSVANFGKKFSKKN
jgi:hypothetical protein